VRLFSAVQIYGHEVSLDVIANTKHFNVLGKPFHGSGLESLASVYDDGSEWKVNLSFHVKTARTYTEFPFLSFVRTRPQVFRRRYRHSYEVYHPSIAPKLVIAYVLPPFRL
jgi:hypothetical protein